MPCGLICRVASKNGLFLERRSLFNYLLFMTLSMAGIYRHKASNLELSNNETHLFQNGDLSTEVEYHPRAIVCVCTCTCESVMCLSVCVRSALSAHCKTSKWTREADAIINLSLRFISQTVMCKLGIFVCFACGIENDLCSGERKLVLICLHKKKNFQASEHHFSARLLCVNHLRNLLYWEKTIQYHSHSSHWQLLGWSRTSGSLWHFNLNCYTF